MGRCDHNGGGVLAVTMDVLAAVAEVACLVPAIGASRVQPTLVMWQS